MIGEEQIPPNFEMQKPFLFLQLWSSLLILIASYWLGVATKLFVFHVTFPLGFWLLFDSLDYALTGKSLLREPKAYLLKCIAFSALLGLVLDYEMVQVARILYLESVDTLGEVFLLYLGWGFCLPAIYESYRVFSRLLRKVYPLPIGRTKSEVVNSRLFTWLGWAGLLFIAVSRFQVMYLDCRDNSIILIFFGIWFILEWLQSKRGRVGLLGYILSKDIIPFSTIFLSTFVLTLSWESMNSLSSSWFYQNIFWLKVHIANVPLITFFGYGFWYILFLSLFSVVWKERVWE